jgi:hypothetical protein
MFASPFWSLVNLVALFYKDMARFSRAREKKETLDEYSRSEVGTDQRDKNSSSSYISELMDHKLVSKCPRRGRFPGYIFAAAGWWHDSLYVKQKMEMI